MSFETNEYFNGNVKSIAFNSATLPATVGVMEVGEYTFSTDAIEHMTVVSGGLTVKFENELEWKAFQQGETFIVAANTSFDVRVDVQTAYLCLYQK
ncbi:MAG: pyrimidine/purine nucleoside phosphorylase [Psychromonas sp.]